MLRSITNFCHNKKLQGRLIRFSGGVIFRNPNPHGFSPYSMNKVLDSYVHFLILSCPDTSSGLLNFAGRYESDGYCPGNEYNFAYESRESFIIASILYKEKVCSIKVNPKTSFFFVKTQCHNANAISNNQ
jgi:hypothetical protein